MDSSWEWVCGPHWAAVDKRLKRLRKAFKRRARKIRAGKEYREGWVHLRVLRAQRTDHRLWERMKRQAIERAAGIT